MAKIVSVGKGSSRYEVIIAKNAMNKKNLSNHLKNKNKVLIITDSGIPIKYIKELKIILDKHKVYVHTIKEGEKSKSFNTYKVITEKLAAENYPVGSGERLRNALLRLRSLLIDEARGNLRSLYAQPVAIMNINY